MLSFLLISTQQKTTGEQNLGRGTPVDNYIIAKDIQKNQQKHFKYTIS